ncbi:GGDEF domain-containing protein [Neopusillimonas aromaticivorans]|uniref:GGDEF domain-containing protein n=1 Tax=Neopusillimonas aromaticivorans TaxID=2979868 RepID=UPI002598B334|nr:GGDEF domain-containing protein [Neopusillimonas aromaticivorans]WJJ94274.1 GGDEF domain-containing protein [Neopusillimonas aromaticivorans]
MSQNGSHLKLHRRDGVQIPIDVALNPCTIDDRLCVLAFVRDLRPLKNLEERVNYQATHDTLTGLHNRWQFSQDLNQALADSALTSTLTAVIMLDLDNFKTINDSHGHNAGDQVLISVANRLRLELPRAPGWHARG